jgi:hypothetical protein
LEEVRPLVMHGVEEVPLGPVRACRGQVSGGSEDSFLKEAEMQPVLREFCKTGDIWGPCRSGAGGFLVEMEVRPVLWEVSMMGIVSWERGVLRVRGLVEVIVLLGLTHFFPIPVDVVLIAIKGGGVRIGNVFPVRVRNIFTSILLRVFFLLELFLEAGVFFQRILATGDFRRRFVQICLIVS